MGKPLRNDPGCPRGHEMLEEDSSADTVQRAIGDAGPEAGDIAENRNHRRKHITRGDSEPSEGGDEEW